VKYLQLNLFRAGLLQDIRRVIDFQNPRMFPLNQAYTLATTVSRSYDAKKIYALQTDHADEVAAF